MIIGIGSDIIEVSRVKKVATDKFLFKYFTEQEIELINNNALRIAGNFACKEAVAKALGIGFAGISPRDIEILRDQHGAPIVYLYNGALEQFTKINGAKLFATISHCAEYATATVVIESLMLYSAHQTVQ